MLSSLQDRWLILDVQASSWEGTLASKAWRLLELHLSRYDTTGAYRRTVLRVILSEDRHVRLPRFLTTWFMAHHPEYLIGLLYTYDLLEEALAYSTQLVQQSSKQIDRAEGESERMASRTCLPWNLLDQLVLLEMKDELEGRRRKVEEMQGELRKVLDAQVKRLEGVQRGLLGM